MLGIPHLMSVFPTTTPKGKLRHGGGQALSLREPWPRSPLRLSVHPHHPTPGKLRTKAGQGGSSGTSPALHRQEAGGGGPKPHQEVLCLLVTGGGLGGLALGTTGGIVWSVKGGH